MKFKRAMLAEPYRFELYDVEENPGPGQVLLKIAGCGLCNWELNFWHGNLNFTGYPHMLGHEYAGVVAEVGEGCTRLKVGDKVTALEDGFGGFGQYHVVQESSCEKLADNIDPRFAFGEPQKCVLTVLDAANPKAGDYGVVQGCGPMGMWCIQAMAGNLLAGLIALDIDDKKLEMARRFGATHTINSKTEDAAQRIAEITGGHMADFVIEGTGVPALLDRAQDFVRAGRNGRLILMSSHHAATPQFDFRKAVDRGLTIVVPHPPYSADPKDDFRRAAIFINNGTFQNEPLVTHTFSLEEINKAFETLDHKPADFMKGVILP